MRCSSEGSGGPCGPRFYFMYLNDTVRRGAFRTQNVNKGAIMPTICIEVPDEVLIDEIVDTHVHLRNLVRDGDGRMETNMRYVVSYIAVAVSIGNGNPPVLDQASADEHIADARSCLRKNENIDIYAAPLFTDATTPEMVRETRVTRPRTVPLWKMFLEGVSNDVGRNVTKISIARDAIRATYDDSIGAQKIPVHIHAERKFNRQGKRLDMKDREWYAVNHDVRELLETHPGMVLVIKHVTDERTIHFIREYCARGYQIYGEICGHYLYKCHEDLYEGPGGKGTAFNANDLCWPIYKSDKSMRALREAAMSGEACFFYGSDWACHVDDPTKGKNVKITNDGIVCGGVTIIPAVGLSLVIDLFVEAGKLEYLNAFLSGNARKVHGWPPATRKVRFVRKDWTVPLKLPVNGPNGQTKALPFMRGQACHWKLAA